LKLHYWGDVEEKKERQVMEDLKIKLSILWLSAAVGGSTQMLLEFYEPGMIDQIRSGEKSGVTIGPALLSSWVILFSVPLIMAFLSITLKDKANRWANIIVGMVYVVFSIFTLGQNLGNQSALALDSAIGVVFTALIVWYAYK
jgi:succinate-acetate transporter protein